MARMRIFTPAEHTAFETPPVFTPSERQQFFAIPPSVQGLLPTIRTPVNQVAQFLAVCSRSKWSRHLTNSPFLALRATDGSKAAYRIISVCANAVS